MTESPSTPMTFGTRELMSAPSCRRWFRFSLRGLLIVVTLASIWFAWQAKDVRDRKATMKWIAENDGFAGANPVINPNPLARLPFYRRWLGDFPVDMIQLGHESTEADLERAKRQFPAAFVERRKSPSVDYAN